MPFNKIFNRVAKWNAERYPRTYNKKLTITLLREEDRELTDAKTSVDKLDALCDIIYVACGALWKHGEDTLVVATLAETTNWLSSMQKQDDIMSLKAIIGTSLFQIESMGLGEGQCLKAMEIVCDSNDSKTATMTAANVKANIDKGEGFIAPEPRLQKVLDGEELWKI